MRTKSCSPCAIPLLAVLFLAGCGRAPLSSVPPVTVQRASLSRTPAEPAKRPLFVDVAEQAGLHYRWTIPGKRPLNILQTIGNGCAFLDYDNDGNLDILLIGPKLALYQGDGKGHFTDVTAAAGLDRLTGHFLGCAVGDFDNDGYDDIYLSAYGGGRLLHNEHGKGFRDVTTEAGIMPQPWGTSCAFTDVDNDGKLDLYIGNYVRFGPGIKPQLCDFHGILSSCGPGQYRGERGVLYRNLGRGRFQDVTHAWGFDRVSGKALGVAAAPLDGMGTTALAVANDQVPGDLISLRGARSANLGTASGMAYMADGNVYGGMGLDWGDYNNDGRIDLIIATYQNQSKCLFRNQGGLFAAQDAARLGMLSSVPFVAFGAKWLDYDNDGWLDLMFANGHVQDNIADVDIISAASPGAAYRQPTALYHNRRGERFTDESARLGGGAQRPIVGRGLATGDYDNDGRIDALAVDSEGRPLLLHNVTPSAGHWLLVTLAGRRSNRDGYGAIVTVVAGGRRLMRHCHADGSYLSSSDRRLHFGLGNATSATVTVRWPAGHVDIYRDVKCDRRLTLREGSSAR
jgi:hypothetical protein